MSNTQMKKVPGVAAGIIATIMGVVFLFFAIVLWGVYFDEKAAQQNQEAQWFDIYSASDDLQGVEFLFISDAFAEYTYGTAQGFYIVFDEEMYGYIVCMENDRLAEEFQANYDYTFTDIETVPALGYVEGYAVEIDEELREYAIEYFNTFWGEEVVDESTFEDYLGSYYLDTTINPTAKEGIGLSLPVAGTALGVGVFVWGIYTLATRKRRLKEQEEQERLQQAAYQGDNPYMSDSQMFAGAMNEEATNTETTGTERTKTEAVYSGSLEVKKQGNIIIALVASILGACVGGVLWVIIYKLGYIAGITGCVAVIGAIIGYGTIGKRQVNTGATIWCIAVSLVVLLLGNAVAYAWDLTEALSADSPGRAQFTVVLRQLPSILKEYELIGSFFADWGMGVLFTVISGFSIGSKKK